jgi:hypothetical protein
MRSTTALMTLLRQVEIFGETQQFNITHSIGSAPRLRRPAPVYAVPSVRQVMAPAEDVDEEPHTIANTLNCRDDCDSGQAVSCCA